MKRIILPLAVLIALAATALLVVIFFTFRIYVPPGYCAVLVSKSGEALPPGRLVAERAGQRGIQEEVLGPGRYFRNPITWDWELKPMTVVPSGNPGTWEWVQSISEQQRAQMRAGTFQFKGEFPRVGVVVRKIGKPAPPGQLLVARASGMTGILEEVLTPGAYKLNPYIYDVELHPAVVIPAGFVGVVTNLFGNSPAGLPPSAESTAATQPDGTGGTEAVELISYVRPLANPGERGTQRDVLQPGIYFINPKRQKVTLMEIGYNEYSQTKVSEAENYRITFPSDTGYTIRVGVTVVWGIDPLHAAEIINEFGNTETVLEKVIGPQLRSICRNIGSTYAARDFIQGEKREMFQHALTAELQRICRSKNIDVLLALVREIEVLAPLADASAPANEDLKRTIQESFIARESQLTKEKQREAETVKAQLEEVRKQVDIARETIAADTRVLVANLDAEAEKTAAEIGAQAALEVATIQQQVAELDAKRLQILGQARADVERMKKAAEAEGYRMLVEAFGGPRAYNLYTFAENFQPQSIKLFYAGEGTFWTDLSRLEEVAGARVLQQPPSRAKANLPTGFPPDRPPEND